MTGIVYKFAIRKMAVAKRGTPPVPQKNICSMSKAIRKSALTLIMVITALVAAAGLTACDDEPGYGGMRLTGTWDNVNQSGDTYTFYANGTGRWDGLYESMSFDYYLSGDQLDFTFYPVGEPPYSLYCTFSMNGAGNMITISFPPGNGFGWTTEYYRLIY